MTGRHFDGEDGEEAQDVVLKKKKNKLYFDGQGRWCGPIETVKSVSRKYELDAYFLDAEPLQYFSRLLIMKKGKVVKDETYDYLDPEELENMLKAEDS